MKKIYILALVSILSLAAHATDIFNGPKHVSWADGGIQISADQFATAKAGDKIVVTYTEASDGIEFKVMDDFNRLPGSLQFKGINGDGSYEQFLTPAALEKIKAAGLEIIGANFNAVKVELLDGKDNVSENTVWTGYFWMDTWSTLELSKASFNNVNWSDVSAIRFCSEANRTDYVINILTSWGDGGKLGDHTTMTMTEGYAELSLEGIDMAATLADVDRLMIQCNKEQGEPFNFTAVELVMKSTGISNVQALNVNEACYDLQGRKVSAATKGIVIRNGKTFISK